MHRNQESRPGRGNAPASAANAGIRSARALRSSKDPTRAAREAARRELSQFDDYAIRLINANRCRRPPSSNCRDLEAE